MNSTPTTKHQQPSNHGSLRHQMQADIKPAQVVAVIDQDEKLPLNLAPLQATIAHLTTGDYSILGLESEFAIERKSLSDYLSCCGTDRPRFDRQVGRLLAYPVRAIVIEATWPELEVGGWRSQVKPAAAVGTALGIIAKGLPVILAGNHERCGRVVSRLLFLAARRRWRENRALATLIMNDGK